MKDKKSLVLLLALGLIFAGCKDEKPKNVSSEKSVVIKSEEQIKDESVTDDFYKLVEDANKDLTDEEKTFLANLLKNIEDKNSEYLSKILAGPLKDQVGGDLRVLTKKLAPVDLAGPILSIKKIQKKDKYFILITKNEDDSLVIVAENDKDKLTKLDITLGSTFTKNQELKKDNQAFVDRSYEIIDALKNSDKELFAKDIKGLNLEEKKFDDLYDGLVKDLKMAGKTLTDKSKVKVSFAKDVIKNAPVDQNLVEVRLIYTFEHIEKIVYDFVYTEDMNLISLGISPDEK